ncbi:ribonuclease H-like domain-containing protein [Tanacetum coccineum]
MEINDNNITPSSPSLSSMKKAFGVTNIKTHVPLVLDLDQLNYDAWSELFTTHCYSFGVLGFLDGTIIHINNDANDWKRVDSLDARALELHEELRSIDLGNLTIAEYFKKIKVNVDLLSNIDVAVDEKTLVMYAINGLGDCYDHVASIICHNPKRPTLLETRSMLLLEESRWYMDTGATSHLSADPGKLKTLFNKSSIPSIIVGNGATIPQWYMDIGATSHLSSHTGNLQTFYLNRNFYSVIVRNGSSIPVIHSGHVQIPNPYRPLHLRNVFVTPNIIKNLVSVRKFTIDNKCSIDFDPYGFSVRDYHTRQTLLRCDSTGDLYPLHVAASAFALLTNNYSFCHQRLGHPGDVVIQTLSSRGLVSYNKNTQHLCRACQLGKQTKLPFQRSTSIVTSPFDIIHSELWTSLVYSMSGYKYYVLFLDHYSHFYGSTHFTENPMRSQNFYTFVPL